MGKGEEQDKLRARHRDWGTKGTMGNGGRGGGGQPDHTRPNGACVEKNKKQGGPTKGVGH